MRRGEGMANSPTIICEACGIEAMRRGPMQFYCVKCSVEKDNQRRYTRKRASAPSEEKERGIRISAAVSHNSLFEHLLTNDASWFVSLKIPFSIAASKNYIWGMARGGGHIFKRQESRSYQAIIEAKVRSSIKDVKIFNNKVWIDLFVQKPNHKSDAINVISVICDGIKRGLDLDDRWFCIRRVDWEIAKENPQIFISISQDEAFDVCACSHCGRLLTFDQFNKKKGNALGVDRVCRDCRGFGPKRRPLSEEEKREKRRAWNAEYRVKNRERIRQNQRAWSEANRERERLRSRAKRLRAKQAGAPLAVRIEPAVVE